MSDVKFINLTDQDIDDYLDVVYFAMSKGTANVSPSDKKKLRPLLRHYAKMKHPFTACVRDNRKRFGAHTEEYCAVLKDLIVGNTKWRGKGKKYTPKNLAESFPDLNIFLTDVLEFENEVPEDFLEYLDQLTDEDIASITGGSIAQKSEFAEGDVVWDYSKSMDHIRREVEGALNEAHANEYAGMEGDISPGMQYWVEDIQPGQALVCHNYKDYYVVPFKMNKAGVVLADEADWTAVEKAWVEQNYSEQSHILAEMFFDDGGDVTEEDGVIWKTIMREGVWKYSPGPGQKPIAKPITVTKDGSSDARNFKISLKELKDNFDSGAKDHVTIPLSHDDKVHENTGFIESLKLDTDSKGRAILKAAHRFTDKKIKEKVLEGSIANVSAGVLFDYIKKDTGTKFNAILGHSALTNSPWLNDMEDFRSALNAGEDLEIISFSEEDEKGDMSNTDNTTATNKGGVIVSTLETETKNTKPTFFDELGLSEDEVKERLGRLEAVEAEVRKNRIDAKLAAWQEEGKSPAVLKAAEEVLLADTGAVAINLSENGKTIEFTLSEVVERLVNASPELKLDEEVVTDENLAGEKPEDKESNVEFSDEEKVEIGLLMFDSAMSEEAAIAKVRSARDSA